MLSDLQRLNLVLFHWTCSCSLLQWNWKMIIIKIIEIFQYFATDEKWCQIWICPMKKYLILFHFHCLVRFSYKIEKFRFWKSLKYFNIFWQKSDVRFDYVLSKSVLIWFRLRCLSSILVISWEIRILNFIEIV